MIEMRLVFSTADDGTWTHEPLPRGDGFALYPTDKGGISSSGNDLYNAVRFQPPGTGSAKPGLTFAHLYPHGYYVVYNGAGQAINIYNGRPDRKAYTHNPLGRPVGGRFRRLPPSSFLWPW